MGAGEDRISSLPDELLLDILLLGSARAVARTSVLSRRWRHVWIWTPLPKIILDDRDAPPSWTPFPDTVDAALAACDAPALQELSVSAHRAKLSAERVEPWLRFASERMVDKLLLFVSREFGAPLQLPACERVTTIILMLGAGGASWRAGGALWLRPPSAGSFRELTKLDITFARMDGSELTTLLCTQCPCLSDLSLYIDLVNVYNVSIRSNSLCSLVLSIDGMSQLEVVAPRLEKLSVSEEPSDMARISAPNLANVHFSDYDPRRYRFHDVARRLQQLGLSKTSTMASLLQRFDEVYELRLVGISIREGIDGYNGFLNETNMPLKCKILNISMRINYHRLVPCMLHLLRRCDGVRKVFIEHYYSGTLRNPCLPSCPCRLEESHMVNGIVLNSLEEVEITTITISHELPHEILEFVEKLSECNVTFLKKVVIKQRQTKTTGRSSPPTKELCEKIRSMCQTFEFKFYVYLGGELVCSV